MNCNAVYRPPQSFFKSLQALMSRIQAEPLANIRLTRWETF